MPIPSSRMLALLFVLGLPATAAPVGRDDTPASALTPKQLFESACATCHGRDGRGADPVPLGLPVAPPDFTDCSFATREPDADWGAIVHDGGPTRAFDRAMPAFGEALGEDGIRRVLEHVRTFCTEPAWPRGELNLPRPLVTEKAFPEDEAVVTTAIATEGPGATTTKLVYERRFGARNQFEVVVPFPAHDTVPGPAPGSTDGGWTGGLGDIAVGVKRVLVHAPRAGSILSVTGEVIFPTGDEDKGLGKGVTVFEPFVTFGQLLPADAFLQFQGGFEFPADTDIAANEAFWRTTVGKSFSQGEGGRGRTWSPMLEVLAARELESGESVAWDLVPQVQVTLSTRQHVLLNLGLRVPVADEGERATQFLCYVLWDWFDGGLFEGW
jgi:mono/diheme cytochrome c family protein